MAVLVFGDGIFDKKHDILFISTFFIRELPSSDLDLMAMRGFVGDFLLGNGRQITLGCILHNSSL